MDITFEELKILAGEKGFILPMLEKDYVITKLLYLLKDIQGCYFKGGTALNKIFLDYARLSEDIDLSLTRDINEVEKDIREVLKEFKITHDKRVSQFVRLIVHYKMFHDDGTVFIDLNERAKLETKPESRNIPHFYKEHIPDFSFSTLSKEEMIAEKMAAAIGRNKPRDHFDLLNIIKKGYHINIDLVKRKCSSSGDEFSIISMFNNAKKLKNRWDEDMADLISQNVSFQDVMKELAKHFKLKEEKEKLKDKQAH
ncbi:MAG: nucleotidyl transferase AbiEii/AbiGii toxin family protein [Nanoarchaeota archaeon]|nr:nucleotidyl transferase AbiEii/AbiGii toxin family protein [Nanoarchaeota archaeon]